MGVMNDPNLIRPEVDIAASLAQKVRLSDIMCISIEGKLLTGVEPEHLSYDLDEFVVRWHIREKDLKVILPFSLSALVHRGEQSEKLASFSVLLRADYVIKDDEAVNHADISHYAGIMGYMHTWPYFRADIQYLSTKLGLPPLVLPVIVSGQVPPRILVSSMPIKAAEDAQRESAMALGDAPNPHASVAKGKRKKLGTRKTKDS